MCTGSVLVPPAKAPMTKMLESAAHTRISALRSRVMSRRSQQQEVLSSEATSSALTLATGFDASSPEVIAWKSLKMVMEGIDLATEAAEDAADGGIASCAPSIDWSSDAGFCGGIDCALAMVLHASGMVCVNPPSSVSVQLAVETCVPLISSAIGLITSLPVIGPFVSDLLSNLGFESNGCMKYANVGVDLVQATIDVDLDYWWSPAVVQIHPHLHFGLHFANWQPGQAATTIQATIEIQVVNWQFWMWWCCYWTDAWNGSVLNVSF